MITRPRRYMSVAAVLLSLVVTKAQVTTADVVGNVTDSSGAVISEATVVIKNAATGHTRTTATNSSGEFLFTLLPIGRYSVQIEAAGFTAQTVSVELAVGDRARLDVRLEVGQLHGEAVEIQAKIPTLQTDSSTVGTLINQKAVQDLPLNGRNFILLAQLTPGANGGGSRALSSGNRPDDRRRTSALAVNGQRELFNNYMIDGMDNNERTIGTIVVRPSMDAIAEMKILTNLYTAEVGRTAGGVVNLITKSGSNDIHGSAFEFFRDDKLEAKNFFAQTKPEERQNQFGGSVGGPIIKERTFFFADYERLQSRQGVTFITTVPTDAMRAGDFSGLNTIYDPLSTTSSNARTQFPNNKIPANRIDPVAANYLALFPSPNMPGAINNYLSQPSRTQNDNTFDVRIDHRFSDMDFFYGRYSFNDTTTYSPSILPPVNGIDAGGNNVSFSGSALQRAQGLQLNYLHVFSYAVMLELNAGYSRYALQSLPPNYGKNLSDEFGIQGANFDQHSSGLTPVSLAGYASPGDSIFLPIIALDNTFHYVANLTYGWRSHNIKTGADLKRRQFTIAQSSTPTGRYFFDANTTGNLNSPSGTGNAIASFLLGYPRQVQRSTSLVWPGMRSWEIGGYVQDDWRARKWLTLNMGVRYDVFTPFTEVADRISNLDLASGKIIIAGKDGISRTAGIATDYSNVAPRFGFAANLTHGAVLRGGYGISFFPSNYTSNAFLKNPPFVSLYAAFNPSRPTFSLSDGLPLPVAADPNNPVGGLTPVARDFRSTSVQQFNVTLQKEFRGMVASAGYVGELGRHVLNLRNINVPSPGPGAVQPRTPYFSKLPGISQITLMSTDALSSYHSLQMAIERRFRNGLSLSTNYTWAHTTDDGAGGGASSKLTGDGFGQLIDNRRIERGNSDQDIRHRVALMANYELPFGRSLSGLMKGLIADWQLNAIGFWNSGATFTVTNATDQANVGSAGRPDRIKHGTVPNPTVNKWFDTSAFVLQPRYTVGNSGRNVLFGPPQRQLDVSLFKYFQIDDNLRLQFRVESFNVTNTPNFGLPNGTLGSPGFGSITTTNGPSRQIQFALKLLF